MQDATRFDVSGMHTLTWSYEKDTADQAGSDAAGIDLVSLPPLARARKKPDEKTGHPFSMVATTAAQLRSKHLALQRSWIGSLRCGLTSRGTSNSVALEFAWAAADCAHAELDIHPNHLVGMATIRM